MRGILHPESGTVPGTRRRQQRLDGYNKGACHYHRRPHHNNGARLRQQRLHLRPLDVTRAVDVEAFESLARRSALYLEDLT